MTDSSEEHVTQCGVPECDRDHADNVVNDWRSGDPGVLLICNPCANAFRLGIRAERESVDMP